MFTRREFGKLTLAGLALPYSTSTADSIVAGVHLGAQTYSFRDLPRPAEPDAVDIVVKAMSECGLGECELYSPHIEPKFGGDSPGGGRGRRSAAAISASRASSMAASSRGRSAGRSR